jgi:hypothetical protein
MGIEGLPAPYRDDSDDVVASCGPSNSAGDLCPGWRIDAPHPHGPATILRGDENGAREDASAKEHLPVGSTGPVRGPRRHSHGS